MNKLAAYLELPRSVLSDRVEAAVALLQNCSVCPRNCSIDRLRGQTGECRTARAALVASYGPHFGEESPLVGRYGSGTIFFAHCNLRCVYCQNYSISQLGEGTEVSKQELAGMMLSLQSRGCHNINLVSPTHVVPQILEALEVAIGMGLELPLVYNSGGYDSVTTLKLLDGIVDIYMPDMKYADEAVARELSGAKNYPQVNQAAVREMHHQVGDLRLDEEGTAIRGLLIRHLVLPNRLGGISEITAFLAREVSRDSYVNVMDQYYPYHQALSIPGLGQRLRREEFLEAVKTAYGAGLSRLDKAYPVVTQFI